jgi:hypothetical protein
MMMLSIMNHNQYVCAEHEFERQEIRIPNGWRSLTVFDLISTSLIVNVAPKPVTHGHRNGA